MSIKQITLIATVATLSLPSFAEPGSVEHSGQASKHSVLAVTDGVGSVTKVGSAVLASPVLVVGGASLAAGSAITSAGESMARGAKNASGHHHQTSNALIVTEMTITADPAPNHVMQSAPDTKERIITRSTEETVISTKTKTSTTTQSEQH